MPDKIQVIKARKRDDIFDSRGNPIEDKEIIGISKFVIGQVPESYIKYYPNRIFDRRKYPDLYKVFGKDHLPNELELRLYEEKMLPQPLFKRLKKHLKRLLFWL